MSAWWAMFCANVDLPTPLGPTRTTLVASARKSSAISASMAARSQRLGQAQSKSQSGLKRPICASFSRRSRLRRRRSCSSQSRSGATQPEATASGQWASKPCRCSASARARRVSASFIDCVLELVIESKRVRLHRRVAGLHVGGQLDGDRRGLTTLLAPAFECEADGIGMRYVTLECLTDGGLQLGSAVAVQQPCQPVGDGTEVGAALGGPHEQVLAGRSDLGEAVGGAVLPRGALVRDQGLEVAVLLDLRALVVAATIAGEHMEAVDDAHLMDAGQHRQRPSDMGMRYGVVVEVEADIGRLADLDRDALTRAPSVSPRYLSSATSSGAGLSGNDNRRGASSANTSRTVRSGLAGQRRSAARPRLQSSAWAFRSSRSVKRRAAKNAPRT